MVLRLFDFRNAPRVLPTVTMHDYFSTDYETHLQTMEALYLQKKYVEMLIPFHALTRDYPYVSPRGSEWQTISAWYMGALAYMHINHWHAAKNALTICREHLPAEEVAARLQTIYLLDETAFRLCHFKTNLQCCTSITHCLTSLSAAGHPFPMLLAPPEMVECLVTNHQVRALRMNNPIRRVQSAQNQTLTLLWPWASAHPDLHIGKASDLLTLQLPLTVVRATQPLDEPWAHLVLQTQLTDAFLRLWDLRQFPNSPLQPAKDALNVVFAVAQTYARLGNDHEAIAQSYELATELALELTTASQPNDRQIWLNRAKEALTAAMAANQEFVRQHERMYPLPHMLAVLELEWRFQSARMAHQPEVFAALLKEVDLFIADAIHRANYNSLLLGRCYYLAGRIKEILQEKPGAVQAYSKALNWFLHEENEYPLWLDLPIRCRAKLTEEGF